MNPNMTFAFIGGPLVAMQIMKLYQKEGKGNYLHIPILSGRGGGEPFIVTHFPKNVIITVYALLSTCLKNVTVDFSTT